MEPSRPSHGLNARFVTEHLNRQLPRAKIVVWEHNSHVGDARSTEMGAPANSTSASWPASATQTNASLWGSPRMADRDCLERVGRSSERKRVLPAMIESHESFLHESGGTALLAGHGAAGVREP